MKSKVKIVKKRPPIRDTFISHLVSDGYPVDLATDIEELIFSSTEEKFYKQRALHILLNIIEGGTFKTYIKNTSVIKERILSGQIAPEQLIKMTPRELNPTMWGDYKTKEDVEINVILNGEAVAVSDLFTCSKCKGTKCVYQHVQTRSCDEGMTTFVKCMTCGHQWSQYN
jgi:DNA-directed RNA polymerase subunit M/transcription elongation factor TFIIS